MFFAIRFATLIIFLSLLSTRPANAALVDGMPAFNASRNAGLYIWRDGKLNWHLRLTRGPSPQSASGSISFSKPFNWAAAVAMESNDALLRTTPQQLDFRLAVGGGDYVDGIDFSAPRDIGLCLRASGSVDVYVGSWAFKAVAINGLIDVLDNGGCVGNIKYHPGHYIAMLDEDSQSDMIDVIRPGVSGIRKRYFWNDLEPTPGNYDFSAIESDLRIASDHGVQLVAMLVDKTFSASSIPTPPYLAAYTLPLEGGGYVVQRWSPYVMSRLTALTLALGKEFDQNPNFEGIAFQETSLGLTGQAATDSGYTADVYRDAIIRILKNTRATMPTSEIFWNMNFIEGGNIYLPDIATAIVPFKIAMGGPDVLPDNLALQKQAYPLYAQFKDRMTLFGGVENICYSAAHMTPAATKYWTMDELFQFAQSQLYVNYLFWGHKTVRWPSDSYLWTDALPAIQSHTAPFYLF